MSELKTQIKAFAKSLGMELCGIASIDRFEGAPAGTNPSDVLPGCKSVVVVGTKIIDGVVQANFRAFEDGRDDLKGIFGTYGYAILPTFELTYACYALAKFIESNSDEVATPCAAGPMTNGIQVSLRHSAVAAGLGEFGYMSIVLTPEYGPRVRFGVILTTLEIEPDPMYDGAKLCEPEKCGICAKVCPTGAIRMPGTHELEHVKMAGKNYEYTHVHFANCRKALQAMTKALGGKDDYLDLEDPTPEDLYAAEGKMPVDTWGLQHVSSWHCGRCQTYCPAGDWGSKFKKRGLSKGAADVFIEEKV